MTASETARLITLLNEKGYTPEEIEAFFTYIAFGLKAEKTKEKK